jgi:hypothetical protein
MNCPIGTVRSRIFRAREAIATRPAPLLDTRQGERWCSTGATGWDARIAVTQPPGSDTLRRVGGGAAPSAAQALVIDGQVIRDARLDAYFEAHRGALGVVPSAVPGGALRSVEILVPQR